MTLLQKLNKYYKEAYTLGHFPSASALVSGRRKFAYYGFLGDGNYGDELVFDATRLIFAPDVLIPIRRTMPPAFALFAKMTPEKFSGIVVGGGTIIGPSFYEHEYFLKLAAMGKPVYMHGSGVYKVSTWHESWKSLLKKPAFGGVRGPQSRATFAEHQPQVREVGDAAFAYFDRSAVRVPGSQSKTVLINLGTHKAFEGIENSRAVFEQFLAHLDASGGEIHFLPCHANDIELAEKLKKRFPAIRVLDIPKDLAEASGHFRNAAFAIGERLHFVATAIMTGCPFLSINYAKKHADLLASVQLAQAGVVPAEATTDRLVAAWEARNGFVWDEAFAALEGFQAVQREQMALFCAAAD
jgi:polysaccharide pyruvyl transferase WcaK-like protein